ncbi:H(+)/Cl(-) exchange transporter ClcA [Pseudobythopirellula maris]|uniref:H(+)/Cl(-) exchange transporter ClcA n=1 Tax=Pseudobythopirellula maris TaxID=2527991 RepID=A0A5C5ZGJ1_9BACT|nr:chloride channel protein [Pseudobythopirellula maris]TWT86177.1 H(+)/Cl(-) exchange transporter ClcA [Pseudobythopirellula maris]
MAPASPSPTPVPSNFSLSGLAAQIRSVTHRGVLPGGALTMLLAGVVGLLAGFGAVLFTFIIEGVSEWTFGGAYHQAGKAEEAAAYGWTAVMAICPALGLLLVAWFTRRFAPEAGGAGVPEVITAVARHDGVIRPKVALVKILASGVTIGTGGSVGREGPIVQIGSALGSTAGQFFRLSARNIKVLVAAGAAAGISATFNAPLAGVMFAGEIILGSFAVESLTPIVLASVIADVVQQHFGEHRLDPAFADLEYAFAGAWVQLPSYLVLGLVAGLAAGLFVKMLYGLEDVTLKLLPSWWKRAVVIGLLVGVSGALYPTTPPNVSAAMAAELAEGRHPPPPLMGVGYEVVEHSLHLKLPRTAEPAIASEEDASPLAMPLATLKRLFQAASQKSVALDPERMLGELLWLAPLVLLKPLLTSLTLAGGGSGGVFAPSLYLGATLGGAFGIVMNMWVPEYSHSPGVYAIVGMGAVVAGTTQGVLSAILIVYEMTDQYEIILPIMAAAGLASVVAKMIDHDNIYTKKLSRRGEHISRGHDMHTLDHVMVRDVMIRNFPILKPEANGLEIVRIAREHPEIESLPVIGHDNKLIGIIRAEDLHRVLDSDMPPALVNAEDIALRAPLAVHPSENLLEAMRDFGARDVETLPVEVGQGENRRLVGLLLRADVIRRYRQELLTRR